MKEKTCGPLWKAVKAAARWFALYLDDLLLIASGICLVTAAHEAFGRAAGFAAAGVCLAVYAFIIARSRGGRG
ncbi:hypothetical protein [Pseudoflavonifractor intestinihominis]|uniref:RDD family protein n=1 Tax=Pseudoflavonifractor intestinihominis TaxID=3133171 RepID=A0ABV1ECG6_9FIRM|nr:hypothetical protein [uncultured Pseudoflavonifractor sp.]